MLCFSAQAALIEGAQETEGNGVTLRIDVEPTLTDASLFPAWIRQRNLALSEHVPRRSGDGPWIHVELGGSTYAYEVHVTAMRDGEPVAVSVPVACECNSEGVLETIDEGIAAALGELATVSAESGQMGGAVPKDAAGAGTSAMAPVAGASVVAPVVGRPSAGRRGEVSSGTDRPMRLGPLSYVGIGVGALGVAGMAVGIPLALRSPEPKEHSGNIVKWSVHPPGVATAVAGGVAVVAGVTLVVIDLTPRRGTPVSVVPIVGGRSTGVLARWRF